MMVVEITRDGAADMIGECDDIPQARAGAMLRIRSVVREPRYPLPECLLMAASQPVVFKCIAVGMGEWRDLALIYRTGGPSPKLLPGWKPNLSWEFRRERL